MRAVENMQDSFLKGNDLFSEKLFEIMRALCPALNELELYEFRYCLENITPNLGWQSVELMSKDKIERMVNNPDFYAGIQLKPKQENRPIMDPQILSLLRILFVGLVTGQYSADWVDKHFTFDPRGFYFIHRTEYYSKSIIAHLGGKPFLVFKALSGPFPEYPGCRLQRLQEGKRGSGWSLYQNCWQTGRKDGHPHFDRNCRADCSRQD